MIRNKKTNKGTRSLQIVLSIMEREKKKKKQLVIISDDFRCTGQGNLKGSDIWAEIWMAGRNQPHANLRAEFSWQWTSWSKAPPEEIRLAFSPRATGRHRIKTPTSPALPLCEHTAFEKVVLNPSNPNRYLFYILREREKKRERESKESSEVLLHGTHSKKSDKFYLLFLGQRSDW